MFPAHLSESIYLSSCFPQALAIILPYTSNCTPRGSHMIYKIYPPDIPYIYIYRSLRFHPFSPDVFSAKNKSPYGGEVSPQVSPAHRINPAVRSPSLALSFFFLGAKKTLKAILCRRYPWLLQCETHSNPSSPHPSAQKKKLMFRSFQLVGSRKVWSRSGTQVRPTWWSQGGAFGHK